ncbi:MAG TPA: DinB family protein, partial [Caulobacteraceae bacterium]|nr:DinB family protein [Caulobacteraceae bacterium]
DFAAPRTSFFPSLVATLNHILIVDWYYVAAIERAIAGLPVDPDALAVMDDEIPHPRCVELAAAQRAVDLRLIAACRTLDDARLASLIVPVQRAARVDREPAVRLLAHLFEHQIHHRGQAHAMLSGTSVAPPQLDEFFSAGEAPLRAAEFAQLGWTEERIWGE